MARGFQASYPSRHGFPPIRHRSSAYPGGEPYQSSNRELINADKIFAGTIDASLIRAGTLNAFTVSVVNLYANNINRGTIPSTQLPPSATGSILDGAVTELKIAALAVGSTRIALNAIGSQLLANQAVIQAKIAAGAVGSQEIITGAVYTNKLAANSIVSSKIATGTILTAHIGAGQITGIKIAANAISAGKVTTGTLITLSAQIVAAIIQNSHIGSLSANKITAGSISANYIKGGTFVGGNFIVGSAGRIQSSDYSKGSLGFKLSSSKGLEVYGGSVNIQTLETTVIARAYNSIDRTQREGTNLCILDTEDYDPGGNFNPSPGSSMFVAPKTGYYLISYQMYLNPVNSPSYWIALSSQTNRTNLPKGGADILKLALNETVQLYYSVVTSNNTLKGGIGVTYMSIHLISKV